MVNVGKNIPYGWSIWEIESCPTSKSFSYELTGKSATFCRLGTSQIDFNCHFQCLNVQQDEPQ